MRRISYSLLLAWMASLLVVTSVLASFTNGGFERGDFTGWTKSTFINEGFNHHPKEGGAELSAVVGGPSVEPRSIPDPNTGGNLKYPAAGHYSARVNNELSSESGGYPRNGNTISQTIDAVIDPDDGMTHIRFTYAAVMVNPVKHHHDKEEKPFFQVKAINTSNGNDVLFSFRSYVGQPGRGWQDGVKFGNKGDYWQYIDWTVVDLVPSDKHPVEAGDQILLKITAAGCALGHHPGYAYVDRVRFGRDDDVNGGLTGLSIQAAGPATAAAGSAITYTYTYGNTGTTAADPTITINPPTNVTFTTVSDPVNCSGLAPVTCSYPGLAPGGSGSLSVTGDIALAAAGTTIVHDDYNISATGFQTATGTPVSTVIALAPAANITLAASGPATVKPGDAYAYTLNYTSDAAVTGGQVTLTFPGHTTFLTSDRSCTSAGGVVTCDLGSLPAGAGSFNLTLLVDKLKKVGTPLTLAATSYSISAAGVPALNGANTVTADVLTPFVDVELGYWALDHIQSIWAAGITGCCVSSPLAYYPEVHITRADVAVMIVRALHGSDFVPPVVPLTFNDTAGLWQQYYIEQLAADRITGGCGNGNFCPNASITRAQMAIFLLRAKYGPDHVPPPATGTVWIDVPVTHWAAAWAEQLGIEGITVGCGAGRFCPEDPAHRSETAVLVQRTFQLPLPTP
jgi:hypothetical protein